MLKGQELTKYLTNLYEKRVFVSKIPAKLNAQDLKRIFSITYPVETAVIIPGN